MIDVNLKGVFNYNRAAALRFRKQSWGRIVNIASINGMRGKFGQANYAASKGGVIALSKSMARELGKSSVTVNCVAPGWIPKSSGVAAVGTRALADSITPVIPSGQNKDLAKAVIDIINNSSINGSTVVVDGGISSSYLPYMLESLLEKGDKSVDSVMDTLTELIGKESKKNSKKN